jgi:hypothetical protein
VLWEATSAGVNVWDMVCGDSGGDGDRGMNTEVEVEVRKILLRREV